MSAKKRVTISDVATAAGVSKTTVSRYINGHPELMGEKTRERIRAVIEMTNYRPSDIASTNTTTERMPGRVIYQMRLSPIAPSMAAASLISSEMLFSPVTRMTK